MNESRPVLTGKVDLNAALRILRTGTRKVASPDTTQGTGRHPRSRISSGCGKIVDRVRASATAEQNAKHKKRKSQFTHVLQVTGLDIDPCRELARKEAGSIGQEDGNSIGHQNLGAGRSDVDHLAGNAAQGSPDIEPTNNSAERALRTLVMLRRVCFAERVLTVVETARKTGQDVWGVVTECVKANFAERRRPRLLLAA